MTSHTTGLPHHFLRKIVYFMSKFDSRSFCFVDIIERFILSGVMSIKCTFILFRGQLQKPVAGFYCCVRRPLVALGCFKIFDTDRPRSIAHFTNSRLFIYPGVWYFCEFFFSFGQFNDALSNIRFDGIHTSWIFKKIVHLNWCSQ